MTAATLIGLIDLFPFLFGGTFIEGTDPAAMKITMRNFPSFSEGLSLRVKSGEAEYLVTPISLPFRRDFH